MLRTAKLLVFAALCARATLHAFNPSGDRWPDGNVSMHLQLGAPSTALLDGATSWNAVAESALAAWNAQLTRTKFAVVRASTEPIAYGNGVNNVFWSNTVYGDAWPSRTIGMCLSRTTNGLFAETDVVFNQNETWNSYRGATRYAANGAPINEFFRTALHEFGHALGLDHPDDVGQRVASVMNSTSDDADGLTADDIAGVRAIYANSVTAPPPQPLVAIEGTVGFNYVGTSGTLRAGAVQNTSTTRTTGSLRLELWAMPLRYENGLPSGSRMLARHSFSSTLAPRTQFTDVNVTTAFSAPPTGSYYIVMLLLEFTGGSGSGYVVRDYREFTSPLTVGNPTSPVITTQPTSAALVTGGATTFAVVASGALPMSYQWQKNGAAISGATTTALTISNAQAADAGSYTVVVRNSFGTATSNAATLGVGTLADPGRLVNLSILTSIATVGDSFTMGYVVGGDGTSGSKPLVIRAAGPSLAPLGVTGTLGDPKIELFAGATKTAENDDWGGAQSLATAMSAVGAFAYANARSFDAAVLTNANAGNNTVKVAGVGTSTGRVIGEIYDATPNGSFMSTTPRLLNVSVLKHIGAGLTAGFVIGGSTPKRILVRAIGPGLAGFGITTTAVADPKLTLFGSGGVKMAENDNWGGTAELSQAFTQVGAFTLIAGSRDAAIVQTLAPGNYTAEAVGNNGTGIALIEVYEVP